MTVFNEFSGIDVTSLIELLREHPASVYSKQGSTAGSDLRHHRQSLSSATQVLTSVAGVVRRDASQTWRVGGVNAALACILSRETDDT